MAIFNSKKALYKVYAPGAEPPTFNPGDFFLLRNNTFWSKLIRFGQWLRYHGENRKYIDWTHTGMFIDRKGAIIEALGPGVIIDNISKYKDITYYVVNTKLSAPNRSQAVDAAKSFKKDKYGWLSDISIGSYFVTGIRVQVTTNNTINCSGLVAMALWAGGIIFNGTPQMFAPADLAAAFNVPAPVSPKKKKNKSPN